LKNSYFFDEFLLKSAHFCEFLLTFCEFLLIFARFFQPYFSNSDQYFTYLATKSAIFAKNSLIWAICND